MLVGGHLSLGAAVDDGHVVGAAALGKPRRVHGSVAGAHHGNVAAHADESGLHALHPLDGPGHVAGNAQTAGLPRAYGEEDVGVALCLQLLHRGSGSAAAHLHAVAQHQVDVLLNGLIGDAEGGDHVAGHAAQCVLPLEDGGVDTGPAQEVGGGDAGGAAADDGYLLAGNLLRGVDGGHQGLVAVFGGQQLGIPDLHRLVVEIAAAPVLAAVGADGAGDEGQRVLFGDELQRRSEQPLAAQLHVFRDVLLNGAAALAGGDEAVSPGHAVGALAAGQRLDGLHVAPVGVTGGGQGADGLGVGAGEGTVGECLHLLHHLAQAVVTAGLQNGGGHCDGPDARLEQLVAVEILGAAGKGDAHFALELAGDPVAHLDGQGEESPAGHIHLVVGQLPPCGVHREGVGELQTELQAVLRCQLLEPLEHGHGVGPLEILPEVVLVEDHVAVAHVVQGAAGSLVAQNGGIALDEGVEMLLSDEIGGDTLDLVRRAAVEGGHGDAAADVGGDGVDVVAVGGEQVVEDGQALGPDGGGGGVLHALNVGVDLLAPDARQVVAHGHIEHKAVGIAEAVDPAEDLQSAPGLDVLVHGLGHGELRGPLLVVALVVSQDAGAGHAGGQVGAVHLLHGFQLEEPGAGKIGGDDVLGQLAVGTGGGTERRLDPLAEDGQEFAACPVLLVYAEHPPGVGILGHHPVYQRTEGNGCHSFGHG